MRDKKMIRYLRVKDGTVSEEYTEDFFTLM